MTSLEPSNCPVCMTSFDADKRLPKIFPTCGHTVCKECLTKVLRMHTPKCPLDQLAFGQDFRSIDSFPTNFLGKDLLEIKGKLNQCEAHQEQRKMICMTDHTLVCGSCVLFGDHKDHDIKLVSEVQDRANIKKGQLSDLLNRIVANASQCEKYQKEKEQAIKQTIKERFELFYETIKKRETEMLLRLDKMLKQEKTAMVNPRLDEKASEIKKKLQEFPQILTNPHLIIRALEEDFTELEKTVTEGLTVTSQKMEEFTSLIGLFENSIPNDDLLKELKADVLGQLLVEFNEKREFSLEVFISPGLCFEFRNEKHLQVRKGGDSQSKEGCFLEKSKLNQVERVAYHFHLEDETSDKDTIVPALLNLSKALPNAHHVLLDFETKGDSERLKCDDEKLQKILLAALSQPEKIEKLEFTFSGYVLGDLGFLSLVENALPKIKGLKSFSIKTGNTQVSSKALKALAQVNWRDWPRLEQLKLDIPEPSFEETDLLQFLNAVPNTKELILGFGNSQLTDQAIENFSTKILPSLDKLEKFDVGFWGTKLTHIGAENLLMNIPENVKILLIGLGRIEMTDESVKSFLEKKLPSLTNLKDFRLEVSNENLSKDISQQIYDCESQIDQRDGASRRRYRLPGETWRDPGKNVQKKIIKCPFYIT